MGVESKKEKITPTLAVSAGGAEGSSEVDTGLLKLKALLMKKPAKKKKEQTSGPFVHDRGGKGAPLLSRNPSERTIKGQTKKGNGPAVAAIADINPLTAKPYPGPNNLLGLKALAWNSTVVYSILTYRRHQLTKKNPVLVPKGKEPPFKLSILDYTANEVVYLPYLDDAERHALVKIYMKLDPLNVYTRKGKVFRDKKHDLLTQYEIELVDLFENRHWEFYEKRRNDSKAILKFLHDPDPYYSEESNWQYLLTMLLEDLLIIDRGVLVKTRDNEGRLIALTPVDGATIRPIIGENGYITQYAQIVDGREFVNIYDKNDIVLFRMNLTPDTYRYGYGMPNMEVLARTVLSDIFIDKGNLDYYRKGGSVPEGFLVVEPPGNTDEGYVQLDKETLDGIQRQLQAIIMSDFTQVPLISGGKFSWIALKGTRKDMQFKELAEYLTRKICAVFQVSPQDVGVIADVNRSTAEAQMSLTRAKGLETLAATISNYFTRGVIDELRPEKDIKLWWDEDDAKIAQEKWNVEMQQLNTGVKTINEVRAERGEDPVPWGDTPFQGLKNWISEEEMMEMQQQGQVPGAPLPGGGAPGGNMPMPLAGAAGKNPGPQAAGPIPSGQMPGQSLGTPANPVETTKSLAEIVAEVEKWENDPELDTTPLVKTFMSPPVDALDEGLSETGDVVVDMLDVADSVLDSIVKDIKISDTSIYFRVSGWLDRSLITKVIMQLFEITPDATIKISHADSKGAHVDLLEAQPYHYEAFSSPKFRLLAQMLSLTVKKIWSVEFITSDDKFEAIKGAIQIDPEKMLKTVVDYAGTLADRDLAEVTYPAVLKGTGIEEDFAKAIQYSGPENTMSFLYIWKAVYGLNLSQKTIEFIAKKIKDAADNIEYYKYYSEFFRKLHELSENSSLPALERFSYSPGAVYANFSKIKGELTKKDKDSALYQIILALVEFSGDLRNVLLNNLDNKVLREEAVHLIQLETPWKVGKKKVEDALREVATLYSELLESLNRDVLPLIRDEGQEEYTEEISPLRLYCTDITLDQYAAIEDIVKPLTQFVNKLVAGEEISQNPLAEIRAEFKRMVIDISILFKRHDTALEEASALVAEGLGVGAVRLELADDSIESLVDLTNNLSTGNPELDQQTLPVLRALLIGEPVDDTQKSIAAALLAEESSEAG